MTIDDILLCLMDAADGYEEANICVESVYAPDDIDTILYLRQLHDQYAKKIEAIKEVASLLLLIREGETVELTADPDGVYYEMAGQFGARFGTMMKDEGEGNA